MSDTLKMAFAAVALAVTARALATVAFAKTNVMVGGQEIFPTKTIVENAVNSADHTTFVTAAKAAGLVDTLSSEAPSRCSLLSMLPSPNDRPAQSTRR
jgi:uncharacterized surface protein with fasciclin (FAS1) repeats